MTKATQTAALLLVLTGTWLLLLSGFLPISDRVREEVVPLLPFWALVSFGAYSLGTLGYDVLTFNDKPEKYKELMVQIKEARADLTAKGVQL